MLYTRIYDAYDFREAMYNDRKDYFTIEGYEALLELFEECGDIEFDCIGICCDFCEEDWEYAWDNYKHLWDEDEFEIEFENGKPISVDEDKFVDELVEKMGDYTWAVRLSNGNIIYQTF